MAAVNLFAGLATEEVQAAILEASRPGAAIDSDGDVFNPTMGTVSVAYARTGTTLIGETFTSNIGGVTRRKTITYARTGETLTGQTETAWVKQ